ncbi:MAG TPA: SpoIID/LytB domain-containing protein [Pyrinomonadaceae bacterium]|nr:SpoIID/LytB domain-containing protein [Pyrinomonadaceae bacterium]
MKLRSLLCICVSLFLLAGVQVAAQEEVPQTEDQILEEEFIRSRIENGDSHASGAREELGPVILGNPTQAHTTIRVGLSFSTLNATGGIVNEFATRHFAAAEISHTAGTVHLLNGATGKQIIDLDVPGTIVRATRDAEGYHVSIGGTDLGTFAGPLVFRPTDAANRFRVENIRRAFSGTFVPSYRGTIELSHHTGTPDNTLNVVNIIEIEDYVPGVVANESIASFQMEALKAQAVAARGYAIANIGRFRADFPYDIVDSSTSQVYRGVISEHVRAVQASNETVGLVASYNGQIISALYSSSMGGHTEHNEWIFNSPSTQLPGTNVTPYLRGIYDGDGAIPDFSTPAGVATFWARTTAPDTYDDCARTATTPTGTVGNTFSRWRFTLTQAQLRAKVPASLPGTITNVEITQRMGASGRAAIVRLTLSGGGIHTVRGWDPLRTFFRPAVTTPRLCGTGTIAANFTLNNPSVIDVNRDASNNLTSVTVWGGGWGHNVGMSQYGAHGRARAGQNFLQILKAYYTGVDIGSYPISIGREPGSGPPLLRQEFYAQNAIGTLEIRNATFKGLAIHINDTYDIVLDSEDLADGAESVDLSPYLVAGLNTIQYNPVGRTGSATVNVNVE